MPDFKVHANALPDSYCTVPGDIYAIILRCFVLFFIISSENKSLFNEK